MNRKRIKAIAASCTLVGILILILLAGEYSREHDRVNRLEDTVSQLLDGLDTSQNALLSLSKAAAARREFLLSGDPAARDRYRQLVQSWKDESSTLDLVSTNKTFSSQARNFRNQGESIVGRLDSGMNPAAAKTAARSATAVPEDVKTDGLEQVAADFRKHVEDDIRRYCRDFQVASGWSRRWFLLGGSILFLLLVIESLVLHKAPPPTETQRN
jgi:CHASE3 domain sensor protein